jgi:hypothetical protein
MLDFGIVGESRKFISRQVSLESKHDFTEIFFEKSEKSKFSNNLVCWLMQ